MIEAISGIATYFGLERTRPSPRNKSMRESRVYYDHLAGDHAAAIFDYFVAEEIIVRDDDAIRLGQAGASFFAGVCIDLSGLGKSRQPMCRACLD